MFNIITNKVSKGGWEVFIKILMCLKLIKKRKTLENNINIKWKKEDEGFAIDFDTTNKIYKKISKV